MPFGATRITLLVALTVTAACQTGTGPDRRLVMAQSRWAEQGPASYRITVSRSCECLPEMSGPVVVTVSNGAVESRHYVSAGAVVTPTYAELFPSIDGLFEIIEAARREDAARLDVTYDPTYGYPTRISIDYHAVMVDDEVVYQVRDFEPLAESAAIPITRLRAEAYSFAHNSGFQNPARLVIRDAAQWQVVWAQTFHGSTPVPPLPAIDFSREMIVVVALGSHSSGGYGILIDGASEMGTGVAVAVRSIFPGAQCAVTAAFTQPVDIARLPRRDGLVRFVEESQVRSCS